MNRNEIFDICYSIRQNLNWYSLKNDEKIAKSLEKTYGFKFVDKKTLLNNIKIIENFDINLLWNKEFMQVKKSDSICAVSSEIYNYIKRIKSGFFNEMLLNLK
jgi:hypothetical protein